MSKHLLADPYWAYANDYSDWHTPQVMLQQHATQQDVLQRIFHRRVMM
jgi:hypothetical protein